MPRNATLYAPPAYITATETVREMVTNGCGPGGWKVDLVPDTIYGLDVAPACNIHDWMYMAGQTIADKEEADRVMLNNLLRLIEATDCPSWLRWLRRRRAHSYYLAVHQFGGPAFWSGKNQQSELLTVTREIWT